MYLPGGWWHYVVSAEETTIGVSFWYDNPIAWKDILLEGLESHKI